MVVIGLLLLAVCAAMFVSVVGLAVVQRLVSSELRKQHNDVAGFIYAVVGIVYAVLLGLVVVAVWGTTRRPGTLPTVRPTSWPRSSGSPIGSPNHSSTTSKNSLAPTPGWSSKRSGP